MAHSQQTKDKIRKALMGNKNSAGVIPSEKTRELIRQTKLGSKNPNFGKPSHNRGKPMSAQSRRKLSASRMGQPAWNRGRRGPFKNMNTTGLAKGRGWNRGIRKPEDQCSSPRNARIRRSAEYDLWRRSVFYRDGFKCIWCGTKRELQADHIKPFAYFPELRFAIDNGRTLCKPCHKTTDTYGHKARRFSHLL
jgi:hypothetical protein